MAFNLPIPIFPKRGIATPPFLPPPPMPSQVPPPPEFEAEEPSLGVPRMTADAPEAPVPPPMVSRPAMPELPKPKEVGGVRKVLGTALQVAGFGPVGRGLSYGFDYDQKMRDFAMQQGARKVNSEIAENEAQTEANRAHAGYFNAQANAKEVLPTYKTRFDEAKRAGASDDEAKAYAAQGHVPTVAKPPDLPNTYEEHLTRLLYDKDPAVRKDAQEKLEMLKKRDSNGGVQDILLNPKNYTPEQVKQAQEMWKQMHPMGAGNEPIYPVVKDGQVVYVRRTDAVGQPAPRTLFGPDGMPSTAGQTGLSTTAPPQLSGETQKEMSGLLNARDLFKDVDGMLKDPKFSAKTQGPLLGRVTLAEVEKLGGMGASPEEIQLATTLRYLLRTQAFGEGGKQLTPTEKVEFIATTPSMNDTIAAALEKTKQGIRILDRNISNRVRVMSPRQREQLPQDVQTIGTSKPPVRMKKGNRVENIRWDKVEEAKRRGWQSVQ